MNDDKKSAVKTVSHIPVISPEQYSHIGRYAGGIVMACFEQIGGLKRMANWADDNPSAFYEKVFPKMISKSQHVDIKGTFTIDEAITKIDALEAEYVQFDEVNSQEDEEGPAW